MQSPYTYAVASPASTSAHAMELLSIKRRRVESNQFGLNLQQYLKSYSIQCLPPENPVDPLTYWQSLPKTEVVLTNRTKL